MKIKTILLMAIMTITISVVFTACGKTNVDIDSMLTVSFTGSNGFGKPVFNTDISALEDIAADKDSETQIKYFAFLTSLKTTADKENLSNGDEITVTTTYNKEIADELGLNVINTETKVTVQGLEALKELKLEDLVEIVYYNVSPQAGVNVKLKSTRDYNYAIELECDNPDALIDGFVIGEPKGSFKNGDTFTLKAKVDADKLAQSGYVMNETEYTVTVEGLAELVTDKSQLSAENIKALDDSVHEYAKKLTDSYVVPAFDLFTYYYGDPGAYDAMKVFTNSTWQVSGSILSIDKLNPIGKYLYTAKNAEKADPVCSMFYFYELELTFATSKDKTTTASGIMVFWLGKPTVSVSEDISYSELSYYSCFTDKEDAYNTILERNKDNYICTEVQ